MLIQRNYYFKCSAAIKLLSTSELNKVSLLTLGFIGGLMLQFVALTQPINALAFVFDGLHYGVSDFEYAAVSMVSTENHLHQFSILTMSKYAVVERNLFGTQT